MLDFLKPPQLTDSNKNRNAKFLFNIIGATFSFLIIMVIAGSLRDPGFVIRGIVIVSIFLVLNIPCLFLLKKGNTWLSALLFVVFTLVLIFGSTWTAGGIDAFGIRLLPLVVLFAGITLGARNIWLFGTVTILGSYFFVLAENFHFLPKADMVDHTPLSTWIVSSSVICLLCLVQFISVRSLEKSIIESEKQLTLRRESELKFRSIFESLQDIYYQTTLDGRILIVSPSIKNRIGYDPLELIDKNISNLFLKSTEWKSVTNKLKSKGSILDHELDLVSKEGDTLHFTGSFQTILDKTGNPIAIEGTLHDITERKTAEEKLKKFAAELRASNTELERFAFIASHDLREPLRMVSSFLGLLKDSLGEKLDDTNKEYINFAVNGAVQMGTLINDLLEYSRLGKNNDEFSSIDLNEISEYLNIVLQEEIKKTQAILTIKRLPVVMANKTLIRQLFLNLVSNALKYHTDERPEIEIGYTEEPAKWIFYVKDNGIGINEKYFEQIFIIFKRLHTKSKYPGTGIGLAICKKIVEIHHGQIWVKSKEGKGSQFFFSIPK